MHSFRQSFGYDGCVVQVRIGLTTSEVRRRRISKRPIPSPIVVDALIDTGSVLTCVDPDALQSLDLLPSGLLHTNSPGLVGLTLSPQFSVGFSVIDPTDPGGTNLHLTDWIITELNLTLLGQQALIGRDILDRCVFTMDGPAKTFTLTY